MKRLAQSAGTKTARFNARARKHPGSSPSWILAQFVPAAFKSTHTLPSRPAGRHAHSLAGLRTYTGWRAYIASRNWDLDEFFTEWHMRTGGGGCCTIRHPPCIYERLAHGHAHTRERSGGAIFSSSHNLSCIRMHHI